MKPISSTNYKENLLANCRAVMIRHGGKLIIRGAGNSRKVSLYSVDGRRCVVWFPTEARCNDAEVTELKETLRYLTGEYPFEKEI